MSAKAGRFVNVSAVQRLSSVSAIQINSSQWVVNNNQWLA